MGKKKNNKNKKKAASREKPDLAVNHPAAAGEMDHASKSGLDLMYRPLPAKVIWMLQHESRCHLAAVDHLRCSWACESGTLRRVLRYSQIDWYEQHGLENIELAFCHNFNQPVKQLPSSVTHVNFHKSYHRPVAHLPTNVQITYYT